MKRSIDEALADLFGKLAYNPTDDERVMFEADLKVVSPSLIRGALEEVAASAPKGPASGANWRDAIFQVYNRKTAEHAQLFPVFHSFETAYRATVATTLEAYYSDQKWWSVILAEMQSSSRNVKAITKIGSRNVTPNTSYRISRILDRLLEKKVSVHSISTGYELLDECDLIDIRYLIEDHWAIFGPLFKKGEQRVSSAVVFSWFDKVRLARNAVYHHQSFSGINDVYMVAEFLLGCIGFPLARIHQRISNTKCAKPPYFA